MVENSTQEIILLAPENRLVYGCGESDRGCTFSRAME